MHFDRENYHIFRQTISCQQEKGGKPYVTMIARAVSGSPQPQPFQACANLIGYDAPESSQSRIVVAFARGEVEMTPSRNLRDGPRLPGQVRTATRVLVETEHFLLRLCLIAGLVDVVFMICKHAWTHLRVL